MSEDDAGPFECDKRRVVSLTADLVSFKDDAVNLGLHEIDQKIALALEGDTPAEDSRRLKPKKRTFAEWCKSVKRQPR